MYQKHHSRSKSDTNFFQEQSLLNGAHHSLKVLRVSIVTDLEKSSHSRKKLNHSSKEKSKAYSDSLNKSNSSVNSGSEDFLGDRVLTLIERVLVFKQELDLYFFYQKLQFLKLHLNDIFLIWMQNISNLQNEIIKDCPILRNGCLLNVLGDFSEILSTFRETYPQDFYREIKDAILNQWEKNRIRINEIFNKVAKYYDYNDIKNDNENKNKKKIEYLFKDKWNTNKFYNTLLVNLKTIQKVEPSALDYLLKRKKDIMIFISTMSQDILFSISRLYYYMDYYSIIISSLIFKIFYSIMYYIDTNKHNYENLTASEISKQRKVFHLINHFISLSLTFHQTEENNEQEPGKIKIDNGGLNSMSKFILNNFIQIVSKCKGIAVPKNISKFKQKSLFQRYKYIYYKHYLRVFNESKKNRLLRIFELFYNSKLIFWRSVMFVAKAKDDKKNFTCRTCEKDIPLNDLFLHLGCCREQQSFYEKMKKFKQKLKHNVIKLEFYLAKFSINITPDNMKLLAEGNIFHKIIRLIPEYEGDYDGVNFLKILIKLYTFESNKINDYYEKNSKQISYLITMIYFSLIVFLINKLSNDHNEELNEVLGEIFSTLLQVMMNIEFLLYIKKSKIKNYMIKNKKKNYSKRPTKEIDKEYRRLTSKDLIRVDDKINDDNNKSNDKGELSNKNNFKSIIQQFKLQLSLNDMLISSKTKEIKLKNDNNSKEMDEDISKNFFSKKSMSYNPSNKNINKMIEKSPCSKQTKYISKNLSHIRNKMYKKFKCRRAKKSISARTTKNRIMPLIETRIHKRNNKIFNIEFNERRSNSLVPKSKNNQVNILDGLLNTCKKPEKRSKSNDSSIILFDINSNANANKNTMISINELSNNSQDSDNDNKLNLSRMDSCLSRLDSNIHRLDSKDSKDSNENSFENNDFNSNGTDNFLLSHHDKNFKLGYIKDTEKKSQTNKLSLFSSKSPFKLINNNKSNHNDDYINKGFAKKNNFEEDNSKITNTKDNISIINRKDSKSNLNIIINCNEEEEEEEENEDNKKKEKENDEEGGFDFFATKTQSKRPELEDEEENNEDDDDKENNEEDEEEENDNEESENIDKTDKNANDLDDNDFGKILPKMIYINPLIRSKLDIEQISKLINELMEQYDQSYNEIIEQTIISRKNMLIEKNEQDFDLSKLASLHNDLENNEENDFFFKKRNTMMPTGLKLTNNINVIKPTKTCEIEEKEIIRTSKFKLILPIAKGGYGSVGLYKKLSTDDMYAIKIVSINAMKEKKLSASLKVEQNILKEINNEYVINSYFIFQDTKNYYFVMEYLPGGDVYGLLSKNQLPKSTIKLIVAETILAINYLHSINIIHHDIKPENILISAKGHFKLSDFGLSTSLKEGNQETVEQYVKNLINFVEFKNVDTNFFIDNEEGKEAVGTLNYMAPELFTGKYPEGGGVDYWAVGVLIFDLFCCALPFEGKTQEETRENIIGVKINWDKLINEDIIKTYKNIDSAVDLIKKFLKENPNERWGDNNLDEIKKHEFFENFNWDEIDNMKNEAIKEYVKERVKNNNSKIKKLMMKNKEKKEKGQNNENKEDTMEEGCPNIIKVNLTENEEKLYFTERLDNLNKKSKEIVKKKFQKEVTNEEYISSLLLVDLE